MLENQFRLFWNLDDRSADVIMRTPGGKGFEFEGAKTTDLTAPGLCHDRLNPTEQLKHELARKRLWQTVVLCQPFAEAFTTHRAAPFALMNG